MSIASYSRSYVDMSKEEWGTIFSPRTQCILWRRQPGK